MEGGRKKGSRPLNAGHPSFAERAEALGRHAQIFKGLKGHVKPNSSAREGINEPSWR